VERRLLTILLKYWAVTVLHKVAVLLAVVDVLLGGAAAGLDVAVAEEDAEALEADLLLELRVALPVLAASGGAGLPPRDEVAHLGEEGGGLVGERREGPVGLLVGPARGHDGLVSIVCGVSFLELSFL